MIRSSVLLLWKIFFSAYIEDGVLLLPLPVSSRALNTLYVTIRNWRHSSDGCSWRLWLPTFSPSFRLRCKRLYCSYCAKSEIIPALLLVALYRVHEFQTLVIVAWAIWTHSQTYSRQLNEKEMRRSVQSSWEFSNEQPISPHRAENGSQGSWTLLLRYCLYGKQVTRGWKVFLQGRLVGAALPFLHVFDN